MVRDAPEYEQTEFHPDEGRVSLAKEQHDLNWSFKPLIVMNIQHIFIKSGTSTLIPFC